MNRKQQAAWDRMEALGGHGVCEPDMCAVCLDGTAVTNGDLKLFRDLPFVQILDLSRTAITDAGLAHLAGLSALTFLNLAETEISESALAAFKERHPGVEVNTTPTPAGTIHPFTGEPYRSPKPKSRRRP